MKVILTALFVALGLGVGAALVLRAEQKPAYQAYSTVGTRVSEDTAGVNLVGPRWNGQSDGQYHSHIPTPHGS